MKIVGITGGIGSGKTTVAHMFAHYGIPIYNADIEAKKLTNSSEIIREQLTDLLGSDTYNDEGLNRKLMAQRIFNDAHLLQRVNEIIHPKVAEHFAAWAVAQHSPYVLKEAAILFESGSAAQCDLVILVTAPKDQRIQRVMERDHVTCEEVEARMRNQWSDEEKIKLADFVIQNQHLDETRKQVESIHLKLI